MRKSLYVFLILLSACSTFHKPGSTHGTSSTKGEQERTVDAMRDLGTAIESYKLANNQYPISASGDIEDLKDSLVPKYIQELRYHDGWGNKLEYYCLKGEGPYYIISLGADKQRDVDLYKTDRFPSGLGFKEISDLNEDIIFSDGAFVRYPKAAHVGS